MLEFITVGLLVVYILGCAFWFALELRRDLVDQLLYGDSEQPVLVLIIRSLAWPTCLMIMLYDYFYGDDGYGIYN
jgi:hypothetical protein